MGKSPCRPIGITSSSEFWVGVAVGALATLILGRIMGWLVF